MSTVRDLYEVLGVTRDASEEDIRKAYRRLARELHPDVNAEPAAEERFKEVVGAYEILSDADKRRQYDAFGTTGGPDGSGFTDIQDIFDLFFGQGGFGVGSRRRGPRSRMQHGEDLGVRISLGFRDAAFGARRDLETERLVACERCQGNGAEPGTAPIACRTCGGTGQVQAVRRSVFGQVMTASPCTTCRGTGQEVLDPCEACFGEGRRQEATTVTIDIPAGVSDGMELRVAGNGHAGLAGGPSGDLYVGISVEPSGEFDRRGQDLFTVLDVSMTQATLGAELEIGGLDGPERIELEPGTESGTVVRIKGGGVPNLNRRGRGDLYVTLHVVTPDDLSREERKLWERLAELRGERSTKHEPAEGRLRRPEF
ncbi:MAG: molecular chaperone DnaJ [Actinomycetota bacterium]